MIKKLRANVNLVYLSVPLILSSLLYLESLKYYFFQDDFYELLLSNAKSFGEFLSLFGFLDNRSSYRPVGLQLYFFLSQNLFGLNPFYFRIASCTFFFGSYFLIYKCVSKILQSKLAGKITSFFWVTSSIHFLSISWIAAAWIQIGTFFFFLALLYFLLYLEKQKLSYYILGFLSFIICAGSFEFFVVLPFVIGTYLVLFTRINLAKILKIITPLVVVVILYGLARLKFASLPQINEYKLEISSETIKNILWYFLWTLNIPEEFKKQVVTNIFVFNKTFISEFGAIFIKSFTSLFLLLSIVFFSLIKLVTGNNSKIVRILIYCSLWFLAGIAPVVFFPNHSFAMYLALPSIGIYMAGAYLLSLSKNNILIVFAICVWLFSSSATLKFYRQIFWVVDSQEFARNFSQQIQTQFTSLPKGTVIYYPLEDERHRQAILNGNAGKVIYGDPSIQIYFDQNSLKNALDLGKINKEDIINYYEK